MTGVHWDSRFVRIGGVKFYVLIPSCVWRFCRVQKSAEVGVGRRQVWSRHSLIHRLNSGDRNSNKGHFVVATGAY